MVIIRSRYFAEFGIYFYGSELKKNRNSISHSNSDAVIFQDMMTSSNGNIFRVTGPLCGEFPTERPVTRSFDVLFDLRLNKRLSKQSWGWRFETPSRYYDAIVMRTSWFNERSQGESSRMIFFHKEPNYITSEDGAMIYSGYFGPFALYLINLTRLAIFAHS